MENVKTNRKKTILLTLLAVFLMIAVILAVGAIYHWDDLCFYSDYDVRYYDLNSAYGFFGLRDADGATLTLPTHTPDGHTITFVQHLAEHDSDKFPEVRTIVIPDSYEYANLDFEKFPNLERLVIGKNLDLLGESLLSVPLGLEVEIDAAHPLYRAEGSSILSKDGRILVSGSASGEIPASVEVVFEGAFFCNDNLRTVVIPSHVKELGSSTFAHCDHLTAVYVSASVTAFVGDPFNSAEYVFADKVPLTVVFESETLPIDRATGEVWQPHGILNVMTGISPEEFSAMTAVNP